MVIHFPLGVGVGQGQDAWYPLPVRMSLIGVGPEDPTPGATAAWTLALFGGFGTFAACAPLLVPTFAREPGMYPMRLDAICNA